MSVTSEKLASAELVGGTQTALHSHAGGGGLPDLIVGKLAPADNVTIATGYWGLSVGSYKIPNGKFLKIENGASMRIL